VWPAARRFGPELIIVSAGFDAHWADPLGGLGLTLTGYANLSAELIAMADALCQGRVIFALEGGYNLDALSHSVVNVAHALCRDGQIDDSLGAAPRPAPDVRALVDEVRRQHRL
jgi:acetoin utilization deacetylase AcuC-like enzyme